MAFPTISKPTELYCADSAIRLRNGNTFVCSGTDGKLLELSPGGEIVWEYRNPYSGELRLADGKPATPGTENYPYGVFRASRIPLDHSALEGRTLEPLAPQPAWAKPPSAGAASPPANPGN